MSYLDKYLEYKHAYLKLKQTAGMHDDADQHAIVQYNNNRVRYFDEYIDHNFKGMSPVTPVLEYTITNPYRELHNFYHPLILYNNLITLIEDIDFSNNPTNKHENLKLSLQRLYKSTNVHRMAHSIFQDYNTWLVQLSHPKATITVSKAYFLLWYNRTLFKICADGYSTDKMVSTCLAVMDGNDVDKRIFSTWSMAKMMYDIGTEKDIAGIFKKWLCYYYTQKENKQLKEIPKCLYSFRHMYMFSCSLGKSPSRDNPTITSIITVLVNEGAKHAELMEVFSCAVHTCNYTVMEKVDALIGTHMTESFIRELLISSFNAERFISIFYFNRELGLKVVLFLYNKLPENAGNCKNGKKTFVDLNTLILLFHKSQKQKTSVLKYILESNDIQSIFLSMTKYRGIISKIDSDLHSILQIKLAQYMTKVDIPEVLLTMIEYKDLGTIPNIDSDLYVSLQTTLAQYITELDIPEYNIVHAIILLGSPSMVRDLLKLQTPDLYNHSLNMVSKTHNVLLSHIQTHISDYIDKPILNASSMIVTVMKMAFTKLINENPMYARFHTGCNVSYRMVNILAESDHVDVNVCDPNTGKNALYYTISAIDYEKGLNGPCIRRNKFDIRDTQKILIGRGATLTPKNHFGITQLHIAAENNDIAIFRHCVDSSDGSVHPGVFASTIDGITPLYIASRLGNYEIIQFILGHHATTEDKYKAIVSKTCNGTTPIWIAFHSFFIGGNYYSNRTFRILNDIFREHEGTCYTNDLYKKRHEDMNALSGKYEKNHYEPFKRMTGNVLSGTVKRNSDSSDTVTCYQWSTLMHSDLHSCENQTLSYTIKIMHLGSTLQLGFSVDNDKLDEMWNTNGDPHGVDSLVGVSSTNHINYNVLSGVGTTKCSWAVDGLRGEILNVRKTKKDVYWKVGDEITFSAVHNPGANSCISMKINNGNDEIMFDNLQFPTSGVFPCFSGARMQVLVMC